MIDSSKTSRHMTPQGYGIALAPDDPSRDVILELHYRLGTCLPLSFQLSPDTEYIGEEHSHVFA